jgi:ribosomal protein S18 acetylase RimI-like enzyme
MPRTDVRVRSLLAATDIDVLPDTSLVDDRGEYVVVRTPTNPTYHWGNFLHFRTAPGVGDRERWEAAFDEEFGGDRSPRHCALSWDVVENGVAQTEFVDAGYEPDHAVALVARAGELCEHPRADRDVEVRTLDPRADDRAWREVVELQVAGRTGGHGESEYRMFVEAGMADRGIRLRAGDGAWFVAELKGRVVASCGVIVTQGRGRFQAVDTALAHRRRGIATRLVHDAGRDAFDRMGAEQLVIGADADYHALALYESLGFAIRERTLAVCWWPGAPNAAKHPRWAQLARSVG